MCCSLLLGKHFSVSLELISSLHIEKKEKAKEKKEEEKNRKRKEQQYSVKLKVLTRLEEYYQEILLIY